VLFRLSMCPLKHKPPKPPGYLFQKTWGRHEKVISRLSRNTSNWAMGHGGAGRSTWSKHYEWGSVDRRSLDTPIVRRVRTKYSNLTRLILYLLISVTGALGIYPVQIAGERGWYYGRLGRAVVQKGLFWIGFSFFNHSINQSINQINPTTHELALGQPPLNTCKSSWHGCSPS
jgi:hypothetical protein